MEQVTSLRRRSSVPKDFGRQSLELHTLSPADTERAELDVERSHIREMMEKDSTSDLVLRMFRVLQMLLGPTVIALSVILLLRFTSLSNDCNNGIDDAGPNCLSYLHAVGALKFCVVPGVFGVIEGVVGMTATYSTSIPLWLPILVDNFTGGFYMGGGCTLAAMLNTYQCHRDPNAAGQTCRELYTSVAMFFAGVAIAYSMSISWWYLRIKPLRRRGGIC